MKIFGYFRSSAIYRVRIAPNLLGIEVEHVPVNLLEDGEQQRHTHHGSRMRSNRKFAGRPALHI